MSKPFLDMKSWYLCVLRGDNHNKNGNKKKTNHTGDRGTNSNDNDK